MPVPCVILAGGLGTRLRPTAGRIPKALVSVNGRPFADIQLEWLRRQGVTRVVYSVGFLGDLLRDHVGDGSRYGIHVDYVDEGSSLRGTGGALRLVVEKGAVSEAFGVLYGDSYLALDLQDVERAFGLCGRPVLMTVLRNEDRWGASNAVVRDGLVVTYDKTRPVACRREMRWIDYGYSILRPAVVLDTAPADAVWDMADMMRTLSLAGQVAAYEVGERFYEVGSPEGLAELEAHLRPPTGPST